MDYICGPVFVYHVKCSGKEILHLGSMDVDTSEFAEVMKKKYPEVPVYVPEYGVVLNLF